MFSLVLPFYNEQDCLEEVVQSLIICIRQEKLPVKLVLVNNGSNDQSGNIIHRLESKYKQVKSVLILKNQGYGYGIRQGLKACNSTYLGYMCGDGQIKVEDVIKVIKTIQENPDIDICKVARLKRYDGWKRKLISKIYNFLFTWIFGISARDINGTPKIFKRSCYKKLSLLSNDWFIDAELLIKASKLEMKIKEIPVIFYPRKSGFSYVNFSTILEFLKNISKLKLKLKTFLY